LTFVCLYNTRQYLNETEVWAGLVVEVVKQLEQQLSWGQRRLIALRFHWQKNWLLLVLRLLLPTVAVLAVLAALMAYGIAKLNKHSGSDAEETTVRSLACTHFNRPSLRGGPMHALILAP
jgi:hypothetical protein